MAGIQAGRRAFTLVELLVAATITVVIAVIALQVVVSASTHGRRIQGRLSAENRARAVFDWLERDLHGAEIPENTGGWLKVTALRERGVGDSWMSGTKPAGKSWAPTAESLAEARFGVAGCWLRLVTSLPGRERTDGEAAGPGAVAYQLIRSALNADGTEVRYRLFRSEIPPSVTLASGCDLGAAAYGVGGTGGELANPAVNRVLAENVIDFGVRIFSRSIRGDLELSFPKEPGSVDYSVGRFGDGETAEPAPRVVDVMIRVLTEEGAERVAALESGRIAGDWWDVALANSYVFTQRIALQAESRAP